MKINLKKSAAWLSAVVILAVFVFSGCTSETPDPVVSPSPKPTASQTASPEPSEPVSENSSEASSDTASSEPSYISSEPSTNSEPSSDTETPSDSSDIPDVSFSSSSSTSSEGHSSILPDISADDPDFALLFSQNPLDIDYNAELDEATSTGKMAGTISKYIDLWKVEVDSAYQALMQKTSGEAKSAIREEQSEWVSGTGAAIESIQNSASGNGSARQLEIAGQILSYYRARAATLYSQLFQIEPDFSFAYQGNS